MSADHDDYAVEPIPGLPETLPAGEQILWQGAPSWTQLARRVFHLPLVALYFAALMAWRACVHLDQSGNVHAAVVSVVGLLPVTMIGLGLLTLLAWLSARTSVYTLTNRRIVMRIGIALPTAINIPFSVIDSADLHVGAGGRGDIVLRLTGKQRVGYSTLWPHARPWSLKHPEPVLRGIADAAHVADLLGAAARAALPTAAAQPKAREVRSAPTMAMPGSLGLSSS